MILGLLLNAIGNGMCVASGVGTGLWTAAAVNLNLVTGYSIGVFLFIFGLMNALTNQLLIRHLDWPRFVGEMVFIIFFSYFVNFFSQLFTQWGWGVWPWFFRMLLSFAGIAMFCVAISVYQRANIFMHPNDDMTNILRFFYLKGNATWAQLVDFIVPIVVIIICVCITHRMEAVNIGTLFSFLFNGKLIEASDQWVMPNLVHNFKVNKTVNN